MSGLPESGRGLMAYPAELDAGEGNSGAGRLAFPALALSRPGPSRLPRPLAFLSDMRKSDNPDANRDALPQGRACLSRDLGHRRAVALPACLPDFDSLADVVAKRARFGRQGPPAAGQPRAPLGHEKVRDRPNEFFFVGHRLPLINATAAPATGTIRSTQSGCEPVSKPR
jgi:hypothetical protein